MGTHSPNVSRVASGGQECPALRLLVVEDHRELCAMLKLFLEVLGCGARFTEDAASALRAADEESFDVLLCDIALPDGNG